VNRADVSLRAVFAKTQGRCHFCGDKLRLELYGKRGGVRPGAWVIDHVIQRKRGGKDDIENFLPICPKCNHLRWHRRGENLRELLVLGLVAKDEVKKDTRLGAEIARKLARRKAQNLRRHRGKR
jgi:5-methylcytosine-specific restriction endonuclease McrA